jgi:hypothetical protein
MASPAGTDTALKDVDEVLEILQRLIPRIPEPCEGFQPFTLFRASSSQGLTVQNMSKHPKYLLPGLAVTLASLLISWSLSDRFNELERGATAAKYRIRGESRVDSSIVILYLSGDDITSLGGLPIKRSYYALIINVLHELGARVVGVDLAFSEHDREHPEYDDLLARVMKESGNVVLSGYFHNFPEHPAEGEHSGDSLVGRFTIPVSSPEKSTIRGGRQLELPIPDLLNAAAGFGHTNLTD